jgi:hypothetical protein
MPVVRREKENRHPPSGAKIDCQVAAACEAKSVAAGRAGYPGKTPDAELAGTCLGSNLLEIRGLINEVTRLPAAGRGPAARARDPRFQEALGNIRQTRAAPVVRSNYAKLVEPPVFCGWVVGLAEISADVLIPVALRLFHAESGGT